MGTATCTPRRGGRFSESDRGFSLVELLVVIIIIGALAGIAIPVFLHQRQKAADATVRSDLHTVALNLEAFRTNTNAYPLTSADLAGEAPLSPGVDVAVYRSVDAYCLVGTRSAGTQPSHVWVYDSSAGGLQDAAVTTCSGTVTFTLP